MNVAEWILVVMLSVALFVFLVAGIVLIIKLIHLANEAQKIVITGQGIAAKADDIVDNVKGMTTVGGIVKTFANRVMENQERRYAEEDAMREAADAAVAEEARRSTVASSRATAEASRSSSSKTARETKTAANDSKSSAKKSTK